VKAAIIYRIASVLLLLFAVGHTLGFASPIRLGELIPFLARCGQFTLTCRV